MAGGDQDQKRVLEKLRKQLALAVRSIQWSYGIFWSISAKKHGALEWGDGYYNGDIKTRKTVQTVEVDTDQLGLQRSDQLRELYESLSLGEVIPQPKRPTAALSPEDLTDAEWYFLVCMSFVFNVGQGLPGKTLAKNGTVWLRNAHRADTKVFSRSLLAKSASIKTIVCFPHLDGVVELGTTELVPEDRNLVQHVKTSFLEGLSEDFPDVPTNSTDLDCEVLDHAITDCGDVEVSSPESSSGDFADNLLREESNNLIDDIDKEASQMMSWQFKDEANSNNGPNNSTSSSDCVSQTRENHATAVPFSDVKIHENQECNNSNNNNNNINNNNNNNVHYESVLSSLLKSSSQLMLGPHVRNGNKESSFTGWDRISCCKTHTTTVGPPQRLLKKVLFEVGKMHENYRIENGKKDEKNEEEISKPEVDEVDRNHVLSERKRREKINERFMILGSLVPSGGKADKVSILDHTIEYLRGLERKVEELESNKESTEVESTTQSKSHDAIERTSDNYGPTKTDNSNKRPLTNSKRKACDLDKTGPANRRVRLKDSSTDNVTIKISDKDVLIELRCIWRESVLSEVMEAVNKLNLHSQTVQSSNSDGIFSMSIKAKCKGVKSASPSVMRQALQKVIRKC
ncbi:hypothetical protein ABFS83_05G106600 [Erythranthe nasuta]